MVSREVRKKIPWLQDLNEGTSPLLSRLEQDLIEDIFYEAESEFKYDPFDPYDEADGTLQKIQVLEENLLLIIQRFKLHNGARKDFIEKFPTWQTARLRSIDILHTIGTSIHTDRRNCNISRLVGNCTSFVGGGMLIASAVLIPFTLGLSTPFAVAGGITTALGSSTSAGASITEIVLLNKKVEEAKAIVEEDRQSFEALSHWLAHAYDVTEALNAVLNIESGDTVDAFINTIRNFMNSALQITDAIQRNETIRTVVLATREILSQEFGQVRLMANVVGLLAVIAVLNNNNPQICQDVSTTMTIVQTGLSLVDMSARVIQPFIKADAEILKSVGRISTTALVRGGVAVIGMSLDVASIALTSIDVHKGSLSGEGNKIIEAAKELKEEADILKKVYFELVSSK